MYRQSCDMPIARNRVVMAAPHVPYTKRRSTDYGQPASAESVVHDPVVHNRRKTDKPVVELTPARVRRGFHVRIALTGAVGLSYLLFTLLK